MASLSHKYNEAVRLSALQATSEFSGPPEASARGQTPPAPGCSLLHMSGSGLPLPNP